MKSYYIATVLLSVLSLGVHTAINAAQPLVPTTLSTTRPSSWEAVDPATDREVVLTQTGDFSGDFQLFNDLGHLIKTVPYHPFAVNQVESISLDGDDVTLRFTHGGFNVVDLS